MTIASHSPPLHEDAAVAIVNSAAESNALRSCVAIMVFVILKGWQSKPKVEIRGSNKGKPAFQNRKSWWTQDNIPLPTQRICLKSGVDFPGQQI